MPNLIATAIAGLALTSTQSQLAAWKTDSALVFLHRSAGLVAPENTVPAFEAAVRQGADGIETDIRKTRDGGFVIYHDDWVLRQRGPSGKIENMTLAETQTLDVGERFGPRWRGTRLPLFEDLLRYARANNLLLYLDIKSEGIYDEVMEFVDAHGAMDIIYTTGGQVPKGSYSRAVPWIQGWNYTEGGEEDPEKMRRVVVTAPSTPYGIMCDDARSIVRALGRHPERRQVVPFASTMAEKLRTIKPGPPSSRIEAKSVDILLVLAKSDPDYTVRQDACWALGSRRDDGAVPRLLAIAKTPYNSKTAAETGYRDFFLKIAAACALARIDSAASRAALRSLLGSTAEIDRSAASVAYAAFGTERDIPTMIGLVAPGAINDGFPAPFVIGYAARFGSKSMSIFIKGLERDDTAKQSVFGLAAMGDSARGALDRLVADPATPPAVRRRAELALFWMNADTHGLKPGRVVDKERF